MREAPTVDPLSSEVIDDQNSGTFLSVQKRGQLLEKKTRGENRVLTTYPTHIMPKFRVKRLEIGKNGHVSIIHGWSVPAYEPIFDTKIDHSTQFKVVYYEILRRCTRRTSKSQSFLPCTFFLVRVWRLNMSEHFFSEQIRE